MFQCYVQGWTVERTHEFVFTNQNSSTSLNTVKRKFVDFGRDTDETTNEYVACLALRNRGRKSSRDQGYGNFLLDAYGSDPFMTLTEVRDLIQQAEPDMPAPGLTPLKRLKVEERLTMKKVSVINERKSEELQAEYMKDMERYAPTAIVDFDETSCGRDKFELLYGCAPSNQRVLKPQWEIGGQLCSVIAAYSIHGFLTWRIFFGTINHFGVNLFLQTDLVPVLELMGEGTCVVCDGASVHKAQSTIGLLEQVSHGHFCISAPYSPELKPVERGFSLVWNRIRRTHAQQFKHRVTQQQCTDLINEAFMFYSPMGEGCSSCVGHWDLYEKNHQLFMDTI